MLLSVTHEPDADNADVGKLSFDLRKSRLAYPHGVIFYVSTKEKYI